MAFGSKVNLSAVGYYRGNDEKDHVTNKPMIYWYYTTGASASLVEVDLLSGESSLLKTDMMMDVGEAINPAIDVSQIEAAFMQGYGWVSMEQTEFDIKGRLHSRGHNQYAIPVSLN